MYEVLYRGFDGLDVAFQGTLKRDFVDRLEAMKAQAQAEMRPVTVEYGNTRFLIAETGAPHGYAFRCDTGDDGAIWFFKRSTNPADWNFRVSVKSMALALYGIGKVQAQLYEFLSIIAEQVGAESLGRVDYAVDVLAPDFVLVPGHFVMHSHTDRRDHYEGDEFQISGKSSRVTSVTVGHMPRRQVIIYDKRLEVIQKRKVYWWEIWNANRRKNGLDSLEPKDRRSRVWRIELRAGKEHLKDRWNIRSWRQLNERIGDLFETMLADIRYTTPTADTNRARWPNDSLWDTLAMQLTDDLFEMRSDATPIRVKEVCREALRDMLEKLIIGSAATYSVAAGVDGGEIDTVPDHLARLLGRYIRAHRERFDKKRALSSERYRFIESNIARKSMS